MSFVLFLLLYRTSRAASVVSDKEYTLSSAAPNPNDSPNNPGGSRHVKKGSYLNPTMVASVIKPSNVPNNPSKSPTNREESSATDTSKTPHGNSHQSSGPNSPQSVNSPPKTAVPVNPFKQPWLDPHMSQQEPEEPEDNKGEGEYTIL